MVKTSEEINILKEVSKIAGSDVKQCKKCNIILPNTRMFYRDFSPKYKKFCIDCYKNELKKENDKLYKLLIEARHKRCNTCETIFEATEEFFMRCSTTKDGLYTVCKKCHGNTLHINHHKRKARLKKIKNNFTKWDWKECLEYFNNSCAYCGKKTKLSQDHLIPLVKNGEYTKRNIVPACKPCNSSKNDNDFETWYKNQNFFKEERLNKINEWVNKDSQF